MKRALIPLTTLAATVLVAPSAAHARTTTYDSTCEIVASNPYRTIEYHPGPVEALRVEDIGFQCWPHNQGRVSGYTEWQRRLTHHFGPITWHSWRGYMGYGGRFDSYADAASTVSWRPCSRTGTWRVAVAARSAVNGFVTHTVHHSPARLIPC